jgi:hypothetical protein
MKNKSPKTLPRVTTVLIVCALLLGGCQSAALTPTPAPTATSAPVTMPTTPGQDSIRITKYPDDYTAFKIEVQGGATIITDPFMMDERVHADIVTESHQHGDHNDESGIVEPYELIKEPGSFDLAGVKITGVAGVHNRPASSNMNNPNIIFVFDLGGIRLAQFASQGDFPTPAMFAQIGKVDVLVIQFFKEADSKLSVLEAQKIAGQLSARIIIPAHGDQSLNEGFAQQLGADFKREPSGILNLSRSDLDQLNKPVVVVLDH